MQSLQQGMIMEVFKFTIGGDTREEEEDGFLVLKGALSSIATVADLPSPK